MADEKDAPRPFDVRTVEYLLRLMTEHDLSEIDLKEQKVLREFRVIYDRLEEAREAYEQAAAVPCVTPSTV